MVSNVSDGIIHHYKLLSSQHNTVTGIKGETICKVPDILQISGNLRVQNFAQTKQPNITDTHNNS